MTTVAQLIEALSKFPADTIVVTGHTNDCCCGECFCIPEEYTDVEATGLYIQAIEHRPSATQPGYSEPTRHAIVL